MTTLDQVSRGVTSGARSGGRAERLVRLRARAMDDELAGRATAADCVWDAVDDEIDHLFRSPDALTAFAGAIEPAAGQAGGEADVRVSVWIRSSVLDAHLACYHAWLAKGHARAYRHLDYVRRLCARHDAHFHERRRQAGPLTAQEIEHRSERGEWDIAMRLALDLAHTFPDVPRYHDLLARLRCESTLAQIERKDNRRARRRNVRRLGSSLYALKKDRIERPHTLSMFEAIARLHVAYAEILSSGGQLAEALVEAEAAVIYWPDLPEGAALRARLESEMQQLRIQSAAKADAAMGRGRRARLLGQQAAKGFRLVEAFRRSDDARTAAEDRPIAVGRRLWESIGLGPLEAVDFRPLALEDAIQSVLAMAPAEASGIADCWQRVSEDNPHMRVLDAERMREYLSHRLFETPFTPAPVDVAPANVAPATLQVEKPVGSREPLGLWVASRRHLRVKLQVLLAIGIVLIASVLGVREVRSRQARTEAYAALRKARNESRHEVVLDSAERFLSAAPWGRDVRVAEVQAAYDTALVRWFHEAAPSAAEADRRIDRYRQLMGVTPDAQPEGER
jgi:hypothetical protein